MFKKIKMRIADVFFPIKARFPLGDFFRANKQKANVIEW